MAVTRNRMICLVLRNSCHSSVSCSLFTCCKTFSFQEKPTGVHRLFAFDILPKQDQLQLAWHMDLNAGGSYNDNLNNMRRKRSAYVENFDQIYDDKGSKSVNIDYPNALYDNETNGRVICTNEIDQVFVSLPATGKGFAGKVYGIKDKEGASSPDLIFQHSVSLVTLSMYTSGILRRYEVDADNNQDQALHSENSRFSAEGSHIQNDAETITKKKKGNSTTLWGLEDNLETIVGINTKDGSVSTTHNVSEILGKRVTVTSEIMVNRKTDSSKEDLIFGVQMRNESQSREFSTLCKSLAVQDNSTSYMVQLSDMAVSWMVAAPRNLTIKGQIAGIRNAFYGDGGLKDLLVGFTGNATMSYIFAVW